ncbi:scavenger receptor cysteine-rich domain-containing protein [Endozoicomonas arenosclerae]|uniref:scavenger receptor cysteine-rich domain-containing protein n=1 Tax=Endozoicomonas arenosclerae TaxID=1633495 RepID=UPI0012948149|nr:scavenger receptor cysteine-rich domain-containing protein [Endozoicomonas arenosclerae]
MIDPCVQGEGDSCVKVLTLEANVIKESEYVSRKSSEHYSIGQFTVISNEALKNQVYLNTSATRMWIRNTKVLIEFEVNTLTMSILPIRMFSFPDNLDIRRSTLCGMDDGTLLELDYWKTGRIRLLNEMGNIVSQSQEGILFQCARMIDEEAGVRLVPANCAFNRTEDLVAGRVEMRLPGDELWGTVCDDRFEKAEVEVVCKQLGMLPGQIFSEGVGFNNECNAGSGAIIFDELGCAGSEKSLLDCFSHTTSAACQYSHRNHHDCIHQEDVGISCKGRSFQSSRPYLRPLNQCESIRKQKQLAVASCGGEDIRFIDLDPMFRQPRQAEVELVSTTEPLPDEVSDLNPQSWGVLGNDSIVINNQTHGMLLSKEQGAYMRGGVFSLENDPHLMAVAGNNIYTLNDRPPFFLKRVLFEESEVMEEEIFSKLTDYDPLSFSGSEEGLLALGEVSPQNVVKITLWYGISPGQSLPGLAPVTLPTEAPELLMPQTIATGAGNNLMPSVLLIFLGFVPKLPLDGL